MKKSFLLRDRSGPDQTFLKQGLSVPGTTDHLNSVIFREESLQGEDALDSDWM